ncbi:MAG: phosphate signaling complex protein PhoU [Ignavibacteriaceae bacterium]
MERQFEQQIEKLKKRLLKMCSLVDEQVDFAFKAIEEENVELAQLVIERDNKVDKYDVKIDKICQKIIALNQPVAMDLRLIMSAITMNTNLERIGDGAVNIAENFLVIKKKPAFINRIKYFEMVKMVKEMIRNSIDSFINNDPKLAAKVIETDKIVDRYNQENHEILRQIERLGDHATNISEDVYFIVEAQMIKHKYEKYLFHEDEEDEEDKEEV